VFYYLGKLFHPPNEPSYVTLYVGNFMEGVGIATGYRLDCPGSIPGSGKVFLFSTPFRPALGPTQPPIQWVPGIKLKGREADHSPSSRAEVKKGGAIPPPPMCVHGTVLN
jgi:hypothetical protein